MKIFVCIESYLPGTLGGGPVRALANLIEHFGKAHSFFVFTRNHDYLTVEPYVGILPNTWLPQASALVYYCDAVHPEHALAQQLAAVEPDWLYLNGALPPLTRACLALRQNDADIGQIPVLIAPHGNLSQAALMHHRFRKQGWLLYAKVCRLYRDVIWHAASERESEQIRNCLGEAARIRIVPMAPRTEGMWTESEASESDRVKRFAHAIETGGRGADSTSNQQPLSLVYFGRLSPEKNLPFAFEMLAQFAAQHPEKTVLYDLIGAGVPNYEAKLRALSAALPRTVQVHFLGQLTPEALQARLRMPSAKSIPLLGEEGCPTGGVVSDSHQPAHLPYHALLMPSLTENFSYTVLESLQAGIPVLISDQTPWRGLEAKGVGWDLALSNTGRWLRAFEDLIFEDEAQSQIRRQQATDFAGEWCSDYYRRAGGLFRSAMRR